MHTLNVIYLLSSPPATRKISFHILLCFPFCLWNGDYDEEGSEEADRAKEEVGVVDVERLCEIFISSSISIMPPFCWQQPQRRLDRSEPPGKHKTSWRRRTARRRGSDETIMKIMIMVEKKRFWWRKLCKSWSHDHVLSRLCWNCFSVFKWFL